MRILWFTNTPAKAAAEFGYKRHGGGWIVALQDLLVGRQQHELGICFFYNGNSFKKVEKDGVVYYGIPTEKKSAIKSYLNRFSPQLNDTSEAFFDNVLGDFKPDLIHVFGTEMGYGEILEKKFNKIVFHLQGLTAPYAKVYFPLGITKWTILRNTPLMKVLKGNTYWNQYKLFRLRAKREKRIIKGGSHFMGRTEWDRNYVHLLNNKAKYYHCEELIRASFFNNQWQAPEMNEGKEIVIGTTISSNLYKGLDCVYKAMNKLVRYNVKWKIFGINKNDSLNSLLANIFKGRVSSNVVFYGSLSEEQLIQELKTCHLFAHPSYIDNSPNSVCEAMMLGMPVVSSSVGGVKSLITHGENGFLFNPYDEFDLPSVIAYLIDNYDTAVNTGIAARKVALERHSPENVLQQLNAVYAAIV